MLHVKIIFLRLLKYSNFYMFYGIIWLQAKFKLINIKLTNSFATI